MPSIFTDEVACSVGLSVCHDREPFKNGLTEFELWPRVTQATMY